jgi:hypothetical protein
VSSTATRWRSRLASPDVPYSTARMLYRGLSATSPDVERCERNHGGHKWSEMHVVPDGSSPAAFEDTVMAICARCCVRRCEAPVRLTVVDSLCLRPIHHAVPHRDATGYWREVGGG